MKSEFTIDISTNGQNALEAIQILTALDPTEGSHISNNLRPPLGIYNTSLSKICSEVIKCCGTFETYFKYSNKVDVFRKENVLHKEVISCIELALYAAAAHVDDVVLIAKGFYSDNKKYKKSKSAKQLEKTIKTHKKLISASVNAIKHNQSRIRLYSLEIQHGDRPHCLHGYFIEGVNNGVVGPNAIFYDNQLQIFSITSLMWEILCFVLNVSRQLKLFLEDVTKYKHDESKVNSGEFSKAVIAAARLPLYSFDETHPFSNNRVIIKSSGKHILLDSGIYGSISNGWTASKKMEFINYLCNYVGDGVTKSFIIVKPIALKLKHWSS